MARREVYEEEMQSRKGGEKSMESKRSIASFAGGLILISLVLIIGPFFLKAGWTIQLICGGFGIVGLIIGAVLVTIAKLYVKTSANIAFYRTGAGKPKVIIDGGAIVVPVIHELIPVLLETMKLEVVRNGLEALICKDCMRADVSAGFYIRVKKDEQGVKAAATTLGKDATNPEAIKERLMEKLVSALRTVAAKMCLSELNQDREAFAKAVQDAVTKDIETNGLFLETVTIYKLDMTDVSNLKENNVFDAQGLRMAAEITQQQRVERNKLVRAAEFEITKKDVETKKAVLAQQQDQEFAIADQAAQVANRQAEKAKEISQFKIEQDQQVATREVEKEQAIQAAGFRKEASLAVESKNTETAKIAKEQAVEVANRVREVAVADAEAKRAEAQANQRLAEAKEQEAAQKVKTAAEVEIANREKQKAVIAAEKAGETNLIEQNKLADAAAYTTTKKAEAEKIAAENQAVAKVRLAEADLFAKQKEAEGNKAVQIVPVDVDREKVNVEAARVQVLKTELEAKDSFQSASIQLELAKLQIEAGKVVGVEMAKAIGQFMGNGDFNIFGSPETLAEMTAKFAGGLGITQILQGVNNGSSLLGGLLNQAIKTATAGAQALEVKADEVAGKGGKKGKDPTPPA